MVGKNKDQAVSAGRGVAYIAAAKMYFMLAGAAIEFILPRLLGRFVFGAYGFVAQAVSSVNNVLVTGTIQAVSRYTTADVTRADDVKATGLKMHLFVGLPIALVFGALAPLWAYLAHDSSKTGPLALSAAIACGYAFYSVLVGSANGIRAFHKQAGLDVTFATLRATAILGAAALGLGVYGAIGGWVAAVAVILVVASAWIGLPRGASAGTARPMASFLGGVATYLVVMNLIMSVDQFLLKRLCAEWYLNHGEAMADAARLADGQVGYYRAVQNLARLPYQLILAIAFVIFPLVSGATFAADHERTKRYIRTTMRYSLIVAGALGIVLVANPGPMLGVPYKPDFAEAGAPALVALALGHVAFALFSIAGTILNSAGRTRDAIAVAVAMLLFLSFGLFLLIPRFEPGIEMLLACGAVTATAMGLGAIASAFMLKARLGAFLSPLTAVRVLAALAVAVAVGRMIPTMGKLGTLLEAAACGMSYLGTLVVTGELSRADIEAALRERKA